MKCDAIDLTRGGDGFIGLTITNDGNPHDLSAATYELELFNAGDADASTIVVTATDPTNGKALLRIPEATIDALPLGRTAQLKVTVEGAVPAVPPIPPQYLRVSR